MQRMLPHQTHAHERRKRQAQHCEPHAAERRDKRVDNAIVPSGREVAQLGQIVADTADAVRGVRGVAEAGPEVLGEEVLVDGGADRDADRAAAGAGEVWGDGVSAGGTNNGHGKWEEMGWECTYMSQT